MNTILEQHADKINGTFLFFDQMIIKGHILQFFSPSGKKYVLSEQNVLLKDFSAYTKTSKEKTARTVLKDSPVEEGLICTLSVVEYCQTPQPKKMENGWLSLSTVNRKCKYYYFYYLDRTFGLMYVKLQTWFPFLVQIYINGCEMMKHVSDANDISYMMYDNFSCLRIEMTSNAPKKIQGL